MTRGIRGPGDRGDRPARGSWRTLRARAATAAISMAGSRPTRGERREPVWCHERHPAGLGTVASLSAGLLAFVSLRSARGVASSAWAASARSVPAPHRSAAAARRHRPLQTGTTSCSAGAAARPGQGADWNGAARVIRGGGRRRQVRPGLTPPSMARASPKTSLPPGWERTRRLTPSRLRRCSAGSASTTAPSRPISRSASRSPIPASRPEGAVLIDNVVDEEQWSRCSAEPLAVGVTSRSQLEGSKARTWWTWGSYRNGGGAPARAARRRDRWTATGGGGAHSWGVRRTTLP